MQAVESMIMQVRYGLEGFVYGKERPKGVFSVRSMPMASAYGLAFG